MLKSADLHETIPTPVFCHEDVRCHDGVTLYFSMKFPSVAPKKTRNGHSVSELKSEQKLIIENIVGRRDVFGQLLTGFGKSVIFSAAAMTKAYRSFFGVCHLPVTITFL